MRYAWGWLSCSACVHHAVLHSSKSCGRASERAGEREGGRTRDGEGRGGGGHNGRRIIPFPSSRSLGGGCSLVFSLLLVAAVVFFVFLECARVGLGGVVWLIFLNFV